MTRSHSRKQLWSQYKSKADSVDETVCHLNACLFSHFLSKFKVNTRISRGNVMYDCMNSRWNSVKPPPVCNISTAPAVESRVLTCAVSSAAVQFVTVVTHTAEHAREVLARSKHTDVLEITLINVCGRGERGGNVKQLRRETWWSQKVHEDKRRWIFFGLLISYPDRPCCPLWEWSPSHTRTGSHLEHSDTGRSRTGSRCPHTHPYLKRSGRVDCKWVHAMYSVYKSWCSSEFQSLSAVVWALSQCVSCLTWAGEAVSVESLLACAAVGPWCVDTVCVGVAVMVLCRALVLVYRRRHKKYEKTSQLSQKQSTVK